MPDTVGGGPKHLPRKSLIKSQAKVRSGDTWAPVATPAAPHRRPRVLPVLALLPAPGPLRRDLLRCERTLHRCRRFCVAACGCLCAGGIGGSLCATVCGRRNPRARERRVPDEG
jgi:hypothetical protein